MAYRGGNISHLCMYILYAHIVLYRIPNFDALYPVALDNRVAYVTLYFALMLVYVIRSPVNRYSTRHYIHTHKSLL